MKIKNVQVIICLVIFSLFSNQAWAADWIYFDTSVAGDVYYDKSSIKKGSENIISIWNKNLLSEKAKKKYFSLLKEINKAPKNSSMLSYYKKLMEIDCINRKIKDISVVFYNEKGKVVYASPKSESGAWNDVLPNTVGEKLINIVSCETVTPDVVAPKVEEPVTPVADTKVVEPDGSNVTVSAAAAPVAAPTPTETAVSIPTAVSDETAAPAVTAVPAHAETSAPLPTSAPLETAAPVETDVPVPTAAPVEMAAPAAAAPLETAVPVPDAAPIETAAPEPAVTDKNLDQVDNKQIETKSTSEEAVRNLLTKWLNSWKAGDMKTYCSYYESNFKSEVTYSNASVSYKTNVRQKNKKTNISIDNLQISADENMATAVFTQYYNSSILKYSGKKKLELRKIDDEWKISREIM